MASAMRSRSQAPAWSIRGARCSTSQHPDLGRAAASLDALSPLKVLARGYSIAYSDDGVATSAKTFKPGDAIRVRMADGNVAATVITVE